jgi:hypothetical protein
MMNHKKKLIEVAVIFAQVVKDASSHPDMLPTVNAQEKEHQRLGVSSFGNR